MYLHYLLYVYYIGKDTCEVLVRYQQIDINPFMPRPENYQRTG